MSSVDLISFSLSIHNCNAPKVGLALEYKKCGKTKVAVYRQRRELVHFQQELQPWLMGTPNAACYLNCVGLALVSPAPHIPKLSRSACT